MTNDKLLNEVAEAIRRCAQTQVPVRTNNGIHMVSHTATVEDLAKSAIDVMQKQIDELVEALGKVERLQESWNAYERDMRPETRNDFLRLCKSMFDPDLTTKGDDNDQR